MIDLRSDTVTLPTKEMKKAMHQHLWEMMYLLKILQLMP